MKTLIDRLGREHALSRAEWIALLRSRDAETARYLFGKAREARRRYYGDDVYIRGLIEFTNCCRNDCYYCGIRRSNTRASRYRLTEEEILACCREGWAIGYRTFVLQGGEDPAWGPDRIAALVASIKQAFPACAVTLSVGEHDRETYRRWFEAGADRYLLRQETADNAHYRLLHPPELSPENRKRCLWDLKEIGYQVGCGLMAGSPGQGPEQLAEDFLFMRELEPDMVGIGPFVPARHTPFADQPAGSLDLTLFLLGLVRLMLPNVLLPATWACWRARTSACRTSPRRACGTNTPSTTTSSARARRRRRTCKACASGWPRSAAASLSPAGTINHADGKAQSCPGRKG